jgi:hypothetical protein
LAAVHPIPSAPKKHFTPASFSAQPDLECKIYPAGGKPSLASLGITVFTDDGYARFHAVRATASEGVQRLAADCKNSAGMSYSYSVGSHCREKRRSADRTIQVTMRASRLSLRRESDQKVKRPPIVGARLVSYL